MNIYLDISLFLHFKHKGKYMIKVRMPKLCISVQIFLMTKVLKCIFWGSNFEEHLCSEMYFLKEQLFWSLLLPIRVAAALCFFMIAD